jgi:mRNA interferase HigB
MNVISRPKILAAIQRNPAAEKWLNAWWKVAKTEQWTNLTEIRSVYRSTDQVGGCLVFNAPQGRRLIVGVIWADETRNGTLFIKHFLTHAEYDKESWKKDCLK